MENTSRNGKINSILEAENLDATNNSVNCLKEEEFSVENLITNGGLKLTISCRTKSCENELDKNCNATLGCSPRTNITSLKDVKHTAITQQADMDIEVSFNSNLQKEHSELASRSHGFCKAGPLPILEHQQNISHPMDQIKSHSHTHLQLNQSINNSDTCELNQDAAKSEEKDTLLLPSPNFQQNQENTKQQMAMRQKTADNSCGPEIPDPLIRMDTLPNVSPESGISSLDESPVGNESPDFSNIGETCDQAISPSFSAVKLSEAGQDSESVVRCDGSSGNTVVERLCKSQLQTGVCASKNNTVLEMSLPEVNHSLDGNPNDTSVVVDNLETAVSTFTHGSTVMVSSPHKISQSTGRKKRGRPPKLLKSHLLKHKKSTLYNSSLETCTTTEGQLINLSVNERTSEEQTVNSENQCEISNSNSCDIVLPANRSEIMSSPQNKSIRNVKNSCSATNVSVMCKQNMHSAQNSKLKAGSCSEKRPRGRPRKTGNTDSKGSVIPIAQGPMANKPGKRKYTKRKLLFTRMKRKPQTAINSTIPTEMNKQNSEKVNGNPEKLLNWTKSHSANTQESSVFQDNELDALLLSVKSSIKSQFKEDLNTDIPNLTFDNPFALMQPPPFPKIARPTSPRIVKPKAKRPKLHVMMRQTKRRKKKMVGSRVVPVLEHKVSAPPRLNVFSPVVTQPETTEKLSIPPLRKPGTFGSSMSLAKRPFFTSCVQPSKILASSRLNVFRLGTGVDEFHRAVTPPDTEAAENFEKRLKKRHKLLYRKSKHKNIIDPVFAADLDTLLDGLTGMTISENQSDNFIRVRPGEMPLPSIFRVIKIDVNRRMKERAFTPEPLIMEKLKIPKSLSSEPPLTSFRPISKVGRKKLTAEAMLEHHKRQAPVTDASDQRLPPKKRHRMVNVDTGQDEESPPVSEGEPKQQTIKKKGKRLRKVSGQDDSKSADASQSSCKVGHPVQQFVSGELTIDTSQSFLACTPSLSPCASRLSTRSSTLPSLSSPSPTGSVGFRARSLSHQHSGKSSGSSSSSLPLSCPLHSLPAASDSLECAECHLLEQSMASFSPGSLRCGKFNLRSLSGQPVAADLNLADRRTSSAEPSPNLKLTPVFDKSLSRSERKRRKSSNLSGDESDSSPPTLECILPQTNHDSNFFSEPPNITSSEKGPILPKQTSLVSFKSTSSPSMPRKRRRPGLSFKKRKQPRKPLSSKKTAAKPVKPSLQKKCNNSCSTTTTTATTPTTNLPKKSSRSVITMSCPEHEPLPLEHCSNRKLVEEIKAATTVKSSDLDVKEEESDCDDTIMPSPIQPPRKRYQRVGLFSDFYKDSEPRKRCDNMVRCRERLTYDPGEHEFGLMPQPLHIGHFYMRQQQDFQLPYDVWWQHRHQQLPKKPEPKLKFRNIRTNLYSDTKVNHRKLEIPLCNCKPAPNGGRGCQDDCLNRMIYTECSPSTCPLGEDCGNQRIQKHEWAPGLVKVQTKDRGIGVVTKNPIKTGNFILEYLGEVVSEIEFRRRMMEEYSEECHHYALHLDSGSLIDGYRMGNIGRYVNHACQPNCEMQKWNVNGLYRMVLFALRDIEAGEELSYDYNFDPFNQETQQECRCGSSECRGVIGGKRSLNTGKQAVDKVVEDYKDKRKSKFMNKKMKDKPSDSLPVQPMVKPMTLKERCYARKHRTFLVRNVDKIRDQSKTGKSLFAEPKEETNVLESTKINVFNPDLMLAAWNERSVKTRLAAFAEDNPELARRHHLAQIFDEMLSKLLSLKDTDGYSLVTPLMTLPSKKKQPQYYNIIREPIAMALIKERVKTGFYGHLSSFNADVMLLFSNVELYCGPKSDLGQVILKLRQMFDGVKIEMAAQLDDVLGPNTTKAYMDTELVRLEQAQLKGFEEPEEDIIRCICGVTRDEGLMLMCEKCLRWQHCDCVRASGKEEHYLCDRCEPRYYDPEILLVPPPSDAMPDCAHYMTLVKDEVQYAVGDCVYVMRDCKRTSSGAPLRTSHRLLATCSPDKLDVFRLDQLWRDPKGERFASGTPYLRPQETFHEPTRKFFHNELFRTPNFEIIPMELVMGKCIVMDPNTYSKGRPKGFKEQDIYICEYRVDKTAHLFHKIQKIWYPINTSKFCFQWFEKKFNMKRTYSPHEVPEEYKRKGERNASSTTVKKEEKESGKADEKLEKVKCSLGHGKLKLDESIKNDLKLKAEVKVTVKKGSCHKKEDVAQMLAESKADQAERNRKKRQERRARLDKILMRLLNLIPGKQKVDLTYLLEDEKRVRKKIIK